MGTDLGISSALDLIFFAATIPMMGGGDPALANNMVDVPIWALHGAKDRTVPVIRSREMIEAIKKAGGNPKYDEYPNAGHSLKIDKSGLLDWLFEKKRE